MRHFEFQTYMDDNATVKIPADVAAQIERNRLVRIVVLVPDHSEDEQWSELTTEQFFQGYADTDAIYDDVPTG